MVLINDDDIFTLQRLYVGGLYKIIKKKRGNTDVSIGELVSVSIHKDYIVLRMCAMINGAKNYFAAYLDDVYSIDHLTEGVK